MRISFSGSMDEQGLDHRDLGEHPAILIGAFAVFVFAMLCIVSLIATPARAQTSPPNTVVTLADMDRGGLFLPSDQPGQVISATAVDTKIDVEVTGLLSRATVHQTFSNPTDRWTEAVYVFPLPEDAAVDRLTLIVDGRRIEGRIEPREVARQAYEEAVSEGRQASLLDQQRPNLFTTAVGNIAPGGRIGVEIGFAQHVSFEETQRGSVFSLTLPTAITPRYIPGDPLAAPDPNAGWSAPTDQVGDADRITPPVLQPGSAPVNPVRVTVNLASGLPLAEIDSPTHALTIEETGNGTQRITFADAEVWSDRDVVIRWRIAPLAEPLAGLFVEDRPEGRYAVALLMPPPATEPRNTQTITRPRELVLVVDRSGSMGGPAMEQAKAALLLALDSLTDQDRLQIIAFDNEVLSLFPSPRAVTDQSLREARSFIHRIEADGGTEMALALEAALTGESDPDRLRQVVFLTDGAVGNEGTLFRMIKDRLGDSRLFTVGVGSAPNGFFMEEAALAGRGFATSIPAVDEVQPVMADLLPRLVAPPLTDLSLTWPGEAGAVVYPQVAADLYDGRPLMITARLAADATGEMAVEGLRNGTVWQQVLDLDTAPRRTGVAEQWARQRIGSLERARASGQMNPTAADLDILDTALEYQLLSRLTSFVAVDEERIARAPDEPLETGLVAGNMPDGMTMPAPQQLNAAAALESLAAVRSMASTGDPSGTSLTLPNGATPAQLRVLLGIAALGLAFAFLFRARRGHWIRVRWV